MNVWVCVCVVDRTSSPECFMRKKRWNQNSQPLESISYQQQQMYTYSLYNVHPLCLMGIIQDNSGRVLNLHMIIHELQICFDALNEWETSEGKRKLWKKILIWFWPWQPTLKMHILIEYIHIYSGLGLFQENTAIAFKWKPI